MMPHLSVFLLLFSLTYTSSADSPFLGPPGPELRISDNDDDKNVNLPSRKVVAKVNLSSAANIKPENNAAVITLNSDPFSEKGIARQAQDSSNRNENPKSVKHVEIENSKDGNKEQPVKPKIETLDTSKTVVPQLPNTIPKKVDTSENKNVTVPIPVRPNSKEDVIQSGALLRGFYVFLGLSILTMVYFLFRSYRLRHGSQPSTTVKKYGITARRSDMEMRPLELDDEDDDTLFEIGNQNIH